MLAPWRSHCSYLTVDNHRCVDIGTNKWLAQGIEVFFEGSGGVVDGNANVFESGELLLDSSNDFLQSEKLLDFNFAFNLADADNFDFATILSTFFEHATEFILIFVDGFGCKEIVVKIQELKLEFQKRIWFEFETIFVVNSSGL